MSFLKIFKIFLFLVPVLLITVSSCVTFRQSDSKIIKKFKKVGVSPEIYRENYQGKSIRFIAAKSIDTNLPTLLFIHGAPGASKDFFSYLEDSELNTKANVISVDRLGYGYSDYGHAETSIENQAESIYTIVNKYKLSNVILISWSFGVPIAAKMMYKHPEIKHSIMIAGAISPKDEKFFSIAKVLRWKLTKWMFSKAFIVSDDEKMTHVEELNKMSNDWERIKVPITYYHGTKDRIVPYKNMNFITSKVNDSLLNAITVKDANHFISIKHYGMVKEELLRVIHKTQE